MPRIPKTGPVVRVETVGRTDLESLFSESDVLDSRLTHTPFVAFVTTQGTPETVVEVRLFDRAASLADLPPETPVMVQWAGRWRSDFFRLTAGDVHAALARRARRAALRAADSAYIGAADEARIRRRVADDIRYTQPERAAAFERSAELLEAADPEADARTVLAGTGLEHP